MSETKEIKDCSTCTFLDEYFGDCCHPKGGGAKDIQPAMDNCGSTHNYAWWEPRRTKPISHISKDCMAVENAQMKEGKDGTKKG